MILSSHFGANYSQKKNTVMENLVIYTLASYKGNLRLCLVKRIIKKSNDRKYLYFYHVCLVWYGGRKKCRRIKSKLLLYLIIL